MERAVNMTEKARISTTCITKFPSEGSKFIQLVVPSFASLTGSIEDAARDGPCAHGKLKILQYILDLAWFLLALLVYK